MSPETIYAIISVIIVSLVSVIAAIPLLLKKKVSQKSLIFLLSVSVGVLLTTVFLGLLPEIIKHDYSTSTALVLLAGFLIMFVLEKFVHWHHSKNYGDCDCGHSHAYNLAPINLIGDGIHNFIDGVVIAGAYAANIAVGVAATISIIFHEIPQEIADFGVLLYSGMTKKKALIFNFVSATTAILGTLIGFVLLGRTHEFSELIIPFAAGNFLYIAASNLLPQLHKHCRPKDSIMHFLAILLGTGLILLVTLLGPAHVH